MASLHEYIPTTHLPKNYGGNLPEIDYTGANWYPVISEVEDHIKKWNSFGLVKKQVWSGSTSCGARIIYIFVIM